MECRDGHSSGSAQPVKLVITVNRDVIAAVITVEQSRQPARVNKAVPASLPATPVNFNRECFICYGTAFNRPPSAPLLLLTLLYAGYRLFLVSPLPSCPCRFYSRDNKDRFRLFRPSFTYAHSLWSREFNRGVIC